jgi:glutamyl-tRNA synthetase
LSKPLNEARASATHETLSDQHASAQPYRGRLAPSPTGYLHLGHARTFWIAQERALTQGGALVLRIEDLDPGRCKPEFARAALEDLRWFGFQWREGADCGGPFAPYTQSERIELYRAAFETLRNLGLVYPCNCSRRDIQMALHAPHPEDDEPIYPGTCRNRKAPCSTPLDRPDAFDANRQSPVTAKPFNWRFRVPDGEIISFADGGLGLRQFKAGEDFGDFIVWRHDDLPSYQLAVVTDDVAMQITEVVRGEDLLKSTARQLLLYRALGWPPPAFYHCALMTDEAGRRLAKRHDALSLSALRARGLTPEALRAEWSNLPSTQ